MTVMPLSLDSLAYEIQYGGPHVHLAVFIICQIIGIILLHYVFRIITYLINRYTQLPQDILKHQFIKAIYQAYQDAEIKLLERTP
ncbi:hypothetical protein MITSMUL_05276 [Mitsuokella multacida DSM 20544]|uniref:Uncharacterized protein n=2 Tax=Mitsuokella multacida TaxID=52226 RepID=C9KPW8_9FIRM|nr:hypothetical protein MITSMUL_05276 [Mitsuokella multacida DSM 20544]